MPRRSIFEAMKVFILVSTSCVHCNEQRVGVFDHRPDWKEQNSVIQGYTCAKANLFELEINGPAKSMDFAD